LIRRALYAVMIMWFPLLILSLLQGLAYGSLVHIPFLRDVAVNVRFLAALPILILVESRIDQTWRTLVLEFLKSGLVDEQQLPAFEAVIKRTTRLRDRVVPEAVIFIAAFLPSLFLIKTELLMSGATNWHIVAIGSNELSLAGWFSLVSMPFFRFLLIRWAWRCFFGQCFCGESQELIYIWLLHTLTWPLALDFSLRDRSHSARSSSREV
jgi:hypothetical protein